MEGKELKGTSTQEKKIWLPVWCSSDYNPPNPLPPPPSPLPPPPLEQSESSKLHDVWLVNNYSLKWRWIAVDIYRAASAR